MNAVARRDTGGSNANAAARLHVVSCALLCTFASGAALALDDEAPGTTVMAQASASPADRNRPRFEVSASSLPRFDNIDGSSYNNRLDMTWLPPRRSALGLSLGMGGLDTLTPSTFGPRTPQTPTLDLGVHWRYTVDGNYRVDVSAWRRVMPPDALTLIQTREPTYGARVEMQLGSSQKHGFVADRGFLGFQLESGARVTLRRSGGQPMIYYRTKF